jgi:hypothetical protein
VRGPAQPVHPAQQLACAAYELLLADTAAFGEQMHAVLGALEEAGETHSIDGRAYWSSSEFPGASVSLRTMSDDTYTIVDATRAKRPGHGRRDQRLGCTPTRSTCRGDRWARVDLSRRWPRSSRARSTTHATGAHMNTACAELTTRAWRGEIVRFGELTYSWQTVAMKKIRYRFAGRDRLPPARVAALTLETAGLWLAPSEDTTGAGAVWPQPLGSAVRGRNLFAAAAAHGDVRPARPGRHARQLEHGRLTLFLFDRYLAARLRRAGYGPGRARRGGTRT